MNPVTQTVCGRLLGCWLLLLSVSAASSAATIHWDTATLTLIQAGGLYGRTIRLRNGNILCGYEARGKSWVRRSEDNGKTWRDAVLVREMPYASAANPELLQLHSGRVLLFYNQRPRDGVHTFAIGDCTSDDDGVTWQRPDKLIYEASREAKDGCWEPAALQLPSGEIQLFFANEFPYQHSDDQDITLLRSFDDGATWGAPERVCHRIGHRDGMPVPLLLRDGQGTVLAIEDNGLTLGNQLQPAIIHTSANTNWHQPVVGGDSPNRWGAITPPLTGDVYAGAPYIRQLPGGETVLSCQSTEGGRAKPRMVVYIGDAQARNFAERSVPFDIPPSVAGNWSSLFVKDDATVTALSSTTVKGVTGLWAIDGHVVRG